MDIQNHFYGHSAVYAAFAELERPRHVAGLIQHGWTPVTPIRTHFADLAGRAPKGNLFVWSHASRGWTEEESLSQTGFRSTPIGAPALYLLDMIKQGGNAPTQTIPTVVFPFHGTRLISVQGDQAAYAREIFEREGQSVICMHVDDLQRPEIVDAWTSAGHTLTTAGERRDPDFLGRVLWLLLSARKIVSNRLATALIYAAAAGTPVSIYGPHFQIAGISETSSEEYLRRIWPEFYDKTPDPLALKELAEVELGRGYMRSPTELRQILGWQTRSLTPLVSYWVSAPLTKAQTILGLRPREVGPVVNGVKHSAFQFLKNPMEHLPDKLPRVASSTVSEPLLLGVP